MPRGRYLLIVTLVAVLAAPCAAAPKRAAQWWPYQGNANGVWEDLVHNHWYPYFGLVPDNDATGYDWNVSFDYLSGDYYVEVSQSHRVTTITAQNPGGVTQLENWEGPRVYLQFDAFTNAGGLAVENIDLYGPITNEGTWTVRGGMVNYVGDIANLADGLFKVHGTLNLYGTVTNDGEVRAHTAAALWTYAFDNRDLLSLRGGAVGSDAELANPADALITGAGTLHTPSGIDNAGTLRAETGALSVFCEAGTLTSTGHLEAGPNAALFIDADEVLHEGTLTVGAGGGVTLTRCGLENPAGATVDLLGGTLSAPNLTHKAGAAFAGFGTIDLPGDGDAFGTLTNQGTLEFYADTRVVGHLDNQAGALLEGRNGDLTVVGDLTNNGTITWENGGVYWEGTFAGTGNLTLAGAEAKALSGTLTLAGGGGLSVTGTGPAQVYADIDSAGAVTVAPEATAVFRGSLSGTGSYQNDGAMTFDGGAGSPTVSVGVIEGAGSVALTGGAAVTAAGLRQRSVAVAEGCSLTVGPGGVVLDEPLDLDAAALGTIVFDGLLDNAAGRTLTKTGDGLLVLSGPQSHAAGAVFEILGGEVEMHSDASGTGLIDDAHLSILVQDAELRFGVNQHLDTLDIGEGGLVRLTGANVVVVRHLILDGVDLGGMTLTPEPATLALLGTGIAAVAFGRRRFWTQKV
jgi:hypothetical protein